MKKYSKPIVEMEDFMLDGEYASGNFFEDGTFDDMAKGMIASYIENPDSIPAGLIDRIASFNAPDGIYDKDGLIDALNAPGADANMALISAIDNGVAAWIAEGQGAVVDNLSSGLCYFAIVSPNSHS